MSRVFCWLVGLVLVPTLGFAQPTFRVESPVAPGAQPPQMPPRDPTQPAKTGSATLRGHVVAFSNNPIWRGETEGSYFLVFNALLNFDNLDAGRKLDPR